MCKAVRQAAREGEGVSGTYSCLKPQVEHLLPELTQTVGPEGLTALCRHCWSCSGSRTPRG